MQKGTTTARVKNILKFIAVNPLTGFYRCYCSWIYWFNGGDPLAECGTVT